MARPELRGLGTVVSATSTTQVVKTPSTTKAGDVIYIPVMIDGAAVTPSCSGFTLLEKLSTSTGEAQTTGLLRKIAKAEDEGEKSYTVEWGGASRFHACQAVVVKNAHATEPEPSGGVKGKSNTTSSKSMLFASATPPVAECMSLLFGGIDQTGTGTPPAGWTEQQDNTVGIYVATRENIPKEATGELTVTLSESRITNAIQILVQPPVEGSVELKPPPAIAIASAPAPVPSIELAPPAAQATASAPAPVPGIELLPPAALATASAPAPAVGAILTIEAPPAVATAVALVPVPSIVLLAVPATATAIALAPTISKPEVIRVAVTFEYPPDKLAWRVEPPKGAPSRWAADEPLAENVIDDMQLVGEMSGGDKEGTGVLARNPRESWPDLAPFSDITVYGPGVDEVANLRLDKTPESDGDRMAISPAAVGWSAALDDDQALIGPGFLSRDMSRWGEPSMQRRAKLMNAGQRFEGAANTGSQGTGEIAPGISLTFQTFDGKEEVGEVWFDGGNVDIGALMADVKPLVASALDETWTTVLVLSVDDTASVGDVGPDANNQAYDEYFQSASGSGRKYAYFRVSFAGPYEGTANVAQALLRPLVVGDHGLPLQGTWPDLGLTASQMLGHAIPLHTCLTADPEDLEDSGYIIQHAWYSDPGPLSQVVADVTKYELLDWFVRGRRFYLKAPGTYGRRWQAYAGPSGLQEAGLDASRSWKEILVSYQDVDGSTRTVGPPGSGAHVQEPGLEITDPDHPAVKAEEAYGPNFNRRDRLDLKGISTPARATEAGERWLAEASLLSRSGQATFSGYLMDDRGIMRPVSQLQAGDMVRFPDAGDTSYRKIVRRSYEHNSRTATVDLDAPPDGLSALLERMQADIQSLS